MSQVISPSRAAVDYINYKLSAPETIEHDGIMQRVGDACKKGGRVITRAGLDALATPVALIETIFFGVLLAITFVPSYFNYECTTNAYAGAKERTLVALDATKNALAGIVGYGRIVEPTVVEDEQPPVEMTTVKKKKDKKKSTVVEDEQPPVEMTTVKKKKDKKTTVEQSTGDKKLSWIGRVQNFLKV